MRIEVNIGVTPMGADRRRKNQAITTACRRAAELLYEDMQTFSFITTAYLLTEECDGVHPARLIVTTYLDPFDLAKRRKVVMHQDQSQDSLFCSMLDELYDDETMVTHWPEMTNLYTIMKEGWEMPSKVVSELQEVLSRYQRKDARKRIRDYFKLETPPLSAELVHVKCFDGRDPYIHADDVKSVRKGILSLGF